METVVTTENSRKSWRRFGFALAAFLLLPLVPVFRVLLPVEQTILLLIPAVAVCSLVAWLAGGSMLQAAIGVSLSALLLFQHAGLAGTSYDRMARGWSLLLAASFGLISIWNSASGFFVRALGAVTLAVGLGFIIALSSPGGMTRMERAVSVEINRRSSESIAEMNRMASTKEFKDLASRSSAFSGLPEKNEAQLRSVAENSVLLVPAMLALESLVALSLAWGLFMRVSKRSIGPPLGAFRDFTFSDQLVWGVAVGATLVLLPSLEDGRSAGLNLLLFFGALYVLRGFGVLAWMSRGRNLTLVLSVMTILAWPLVGALALSLGLGDTWLDWRHRARTA